MQKRRIISLAILSALVLSTRSSCGQGAPASGLYEIISGRYTECCGIGGESVYPLPNTAQGFVELIIDPRWNLAQLTFLGQDMHTVFGIPAEEPASGFSFLFREGAVFPDHIQFEGLIPPPGPEQPYFSYVVSNSTDRLRIDGAVIIPCTGCADFFTEFGHTNVVAVLKTAGGKPRIRLPTTSTNGVFGFSIWDGRSGQTNVVEASADLSTWTPLSTNVFPATACPECPFIEFRDLASTNLARRFYRTFSLP